MAAEKKSRTGREYVLNNVVLLYVYHGMGVLEGWSRGIS